MKRRLIVTIGLTAALLLGIALVVCFDLTLTVVDHFGGDAGPVIASIRRRGVTTTSGSEICGLVFGAAVHGNSSPGPGIERRVATAARLYREKILEHIILSGGKGGSEVKSEATVMRDVALADGIPDRVITMEGNSRSTWENLRNSRPLTGSCSLVIGISDRYHLARIGFLARLQGWGSLRTYPSDQEAPWYFEVQSIGREVAAMLYYLALSPLLTTSPPTPLLQTSAGEGRTVKISTYD